MGHGGVELDDTRDHVWRAQCGAIRLELYLGPTQNTKYQQKNRTLAQHPTHASPQPRACLLPWSSSHDLPAQQ
jgi:hypothetical protein